MSSVNKVIVFLTACVLLYRAECAKIRHENATDTPAHHELKQHENVEFAHKLENAPIPSVHNGPQVLKFRGGPIADVSDEHVKELGHERIVRHITRFNSPNPQNPHGRSDGPHQRIVSNEEDTGASKLFHHPGHSSELSSNHPKNRYNYYNTFNVYGSAYQYGNSEPIKGYTQTANVGVIPPRNANLKSYYNRISGLSDFPIIKQLSSLQGDQIYTYGYGNRDYIKNAYRNVLTGLAMWSILNGLVNGKRYAVYDYKTLPKDYPTEITLPNDTVIPCFEDAAALCRSYAKPLCVNNGTTYCVSSAIVPCKDNLLGSTCVDTSEPCDDCQDPKSTSTPCAANITVVHRMVDNEEKSSNLSDDPNDRDILCATTLVVPQTKNLDQEPCEKSSCLESAMESNTDSIIENTTVA